MFHHRKQPETPDREEDDLPTEEIEEYLPPVRRTSPKCRIYNADVCDEDLDSYSKAVYEGKRRHPILAAIIKLILALVVLGLCVWLLKMLQSGGLV